MKKVLLFASMLLIASSVLAQNKLPIGGKTYVTEVVGPMSHDSVDKVAMVNLNHVNKAIGMDTVNGQFAMSIGDSQLYFLRKKVWLKILSYLDSNTTHGYVSKYKFDSTVASLAGMSVGGDSTIFATRYYVRTNFVRLQDSNVVYTSKHYVDSGLASIHVGSGVHSVGDTVNGAVNGEVFFAKGTKLGQNKNFLYDTSQKSLNIVNDTGNRTAFMRDRGDTAVIGTISADSNAIGIKLITTGNSTENDIVFKMGGAGELHLRTALAGGSINTAFFRPSSGTVAYTTDILNYPVNVVNYGTVTTIPATGTYDYEVQGGTGLTTILLPTGTTSPVGTEFMVSDLGMSAAMYNIVVDAGTSNVIVGMIANQTFTISVSGAGYKFRKVTATTWKVTPMHDPQSPTWIKIPAVTYDQFTVGAFTQTINTTYSLPPRTVIHGALIIPTVTFSGGAISSFTISIGSLLTGNTVKYSTAVNVFTGAGTEDPQTLTGLESLTVSTPLTITATAQGGFVRACTQGTAAIYLLVSSLP